MKPFYNIFFLLTFYNAFSQTIPFKTDLKLSGKVKSIRFFDDYKWNEYYFNRQGKLEKLISISELGKKHVYRAEYNYSKDVLIRIDQFYNDISGGIIENKYDGANLVLTTISSVDNGKTELYSSESFCYADGKLISKSLTYTTGGSKEVEISYNDNGYVKETNEYYETNELSHIVKEVKSGNTIVNESFVFHYFDGLLASPEVRTYIYDDSNNLIEESYYHKNGYDDSTYIYTYNNDILENVKYYHKKDELWMEVFYDKEGNRIKEIRPGDPEEIKEFKNYYNKYGDLIKVKTSDNRFHSKQTFKYDIKYWK